MRVLALAVFRPREAGKTLNVVNANIGTRMGGDVQFHLPAELELISELVHWSDGGKEGWMGGGEKK